MSHRSRRSDDRSYSSSHSTYKYDKYEHRHRRDDSRDRSDHYHHSRKSSRRDRHRSKSRSPSHSSKSYSRHHRSRSQSQGYSSSRHDDHHSRSHRHKDYKELADSKSRHDSQEHSQSKHTAAPQERSSDQTKAKAEKPIADTSAERGPISISYLMHENSESNEYATEAEPKPIPVDPNDPDGALEEEKQRIQRETLERLQKHLEKEGKSYKQKPQASHPIYANDGSFLEMFKNMQQQQQYSVVEAQPVQPVATTSKAAPVSRFPPMKRRGAKILKTGIVQKQRAVEEPDDAQPNDSWNAYLKEVKQYKTVTCSDDNMTRSLVK